MKKVLIVGVLLVFILSGTITAGIATSTEEKMQQKIPMYIAHTGYIAYRSYIGWVKNLRYDNETKKFHADVFGGLKGSAFEGIKIVSEKNVSFDGVGFLIDFLLRNFGVHYTGFVWAYQNF